VSTPDDIRDVRAALVILDGIAERAGPVFEREGWDGVAGARELLRAWLLEEEAAS
jgi:hypothetical protein